MPDGDRERLQSIKTFSHLVKYLRDELDWPIETEDFEDLTFDYEPEELGIDPGTAAKIEEIKQLRPLVTNQPWGIFFAKFEPKRLPVVVLRRILSQLVLRKRVSSKKSEQPLWHLHDLLFISNYGEDNQRQMTFAHFTQDEKLGGLPTLRVLGWDDADTVLHIEYVHRELKEKLLWPDDETDLDSWRQQWSSAFVLRHREVITTSKDLATRLADLAKRIRSRARVVLSVESQKGPLRQLHKAFQEALIHDLNEDDFADMYAQTITYGLFSAACSRPMGIIADNLADMVPITNPFLKEMLGTFLTVSGRRWKMDFDELGIQEVVDLLNSPDTHLEAVLRDFGNRTRQEDPVVHFYELFLTEYDKKKKVQRGVFYTPQPVVSYIVRSVHELLQTEFGIEDGLASTVTWGEMTRRYPEIKLPVIKPKNPRDPSSEEILLSPEEPFVQILDPATGTATFLVEVIEIVYSTMREKWLKAGNKEAEIEKLWNDYVPKHLLPRLYGYELMMAPYAIAHMKLGLKLYETGYHFESEDRVRVFLTNALEPPSDIQFRLTGVFPALAHEAEGVNLVKRTEQFTVVIGNPPYSKSSANRGLIAESLVANYKALVRSERNIQPLSDDYLKFMGLSRQLLMKVGVGIHGMITNRGYLAGLIHRGVRETIVNDFNMVRIYDLHGDSNVGEAPPMGKHNDNVFDIQQGVAIGVFVKVPAQRGEVSHAELWGTRTEKYTTLSDRQTNWQVVSPAPPLYMFCSQERISIDYERFISLEDVFELNNGGIKTHRDDIVIDCDRASLIRKLREYISSNPDDGFEDVRQDLRKNDQWTHRIIPILYRPFDFRWIFYEPRLIDRPRSNVAKQMFSGKNVGLVTVRQVPSLAFNHALVSRHSIEMKTGSHDRGANLSPLFRKDDVGLLALDHPSDDKDRLRMTPNLRSEFVSRLRNRISRLPIPEDILAYIYALLYSPSYRLTYRNQLSTDYARIPLPVSDEQFKSLCELGSELVALHLVESPKLNTHITKWHGSTPSNEVEKVTYSDNTVWVDKGQSEGFRGVPENVWNFHIGGYQVCEKWLKDRKGRVLSAEDITHYQKVVVALNETIRLMKEIDEVIEKHGGWPDAFV